MAVKLDMKVLLEVVRAEKYARTLADYEVVTVEQCAALTEERLMEWGMDNWPVRDAIFRAKELLSSRDDVVHQELLVRAGANSCNFNFN